MRHNYLVTYDIRDPKRLKKVFKACKGYGLHLQYSVFECDLTSRERVDFETALGKLIKEDEDQVLFVHLGPSESRGETTITSLGQAYHKLDVPCYVV